MEDQDPLGEAVNFDEEQTDSSADVILRNTQEITPAPSAPGRDYRLYLPKHAGWEAVIKQTWEPEHCYSKFPGEDWFHFLANGEIYIQRGSEKYCLTCALQQKILTRNRIYWEKGAAEPED